MVEAFKQQRRRDNKQKRIHITFNSIALIFYSSKKTWNMASK